MKTRTRPSRPISAARGKRVGQRRQDRPRAPLGEDRSHDPTRDREDHALGEKLPHDTPRARPESGADGEFPTPPGRARQQQVRHVGAGDQQHEADRSEQHEKDALDAADDVFLEGHEGDPRPLVRLRVRRLQVPRDPVHVRAGLLRGHPRAQATDDAGPHADPAVAKGLIRPLSDRYVDVRFVGHGRTGRRHADDGVGLAVERDALARDVLRHRELALPHALPQHDDRPGTGLVLLRKKRPAQHRLDAEQRKELGRDHVGLEPLRLARPGQVEVVRAIGAERREDAVVLPPVQVVEVGDRTHPERPRPRVDGVELLRSREREGIEQHPADHGEEGRVRADPERQREHRDGREARVPAQNPEPVSNILPEAPQVSPPEARETGRALPGRYAPRRALFPGSAATHRVLKPVNPSAAGRPGRCRAPSCPRSRVSGRSWPDGSGPRARRGRAARARSS